jgi:NADH-quinone oxidoreductase subunit J
MTVSVGTILFLVLGLIAIAAAIGMLTATNAVHAVLFLVVNFFCIALFYLGLGAPFLAMVQITVYAGAIMVLFLFVIMLLGAERVPLQSRLRWQTPLAVILVVALMVAAGLVFFSSQVGITVTDIPSLGAGNDPTSYGSPQLLARTLFANYLLPFEITGVLLLVAMIGAVVLAKDEKKKPPAAQQPTTEA